MLILLLLDKRGPLCGYRLYKIISGYGLVSQPAAVYRALQKLADRGLVRECREECLVEESNGVRRYTRYQITEEGRRELNHILELFNKIEKLVKDLTKPQ